MIEQWIKKPVITLNDLLLSSFSYTELDTITNTPVKQIASNIRIHTL